MEGVKNQVLATVDEARRQVKVTVGRRLSNDSSAAPPLPRPAGTKGLVIEDDEEEGFSVVERRAPAPRVMRQASEDQPQAMASGTYLVGGDGAGDEEDGARRHHPMRMKSPRATQATPATQAIECNQPPRSFAL
jgi:hypothetical protein